MSAAALHFAHLHVQSTTWKGPQEHVRYEARQAENVEPTRAYDETFLRRRKKIYSVFLWTENQAPPEGRCLMTFIGEPLEWHSQGKMYHTILPIAIYIIVELCHFAPPESAHPLRLFYLDRARRSSGVVL